MSSSALDAVVPRPTVVHNLCVGQEGRGGCSLSAIACLIINDVSTHLH